MTISSRAGREGGTVVKKNHGRGKPRHGENYFALEGRRNCAEFGEKKGYLADFRKKGQGSRYGGKWAYSWEVV